jgi:hypothetical protein
LYSPPSLDSSVKPTMTVSLASATGPRNVTIPDVGDGSLERVSGVVGQAADDGFWTGENPDVLGLTLVGAAPNQREHVSRNAAQRHPKRGDLH